MRCSIAGIFISLTVSRDYGALISSMIVQKELGKKSFWGDDLHQLIRRIMYHTPGAKLELEAITLHM